jgi:hypothetical protein
VKKKIFFGLGSWDTAFALLKEKCYLARGREPLNLSPFSLGGALEKLTTGGRDGLFQAL